jgi:ADP-ribose pyrophosphatase
MERSVAGIILLEGKVFVAKRGSQGSFSGFWEFPGGKVEAGESDQAALAREFDEEFGVSVHPVRLLGEAIFPHRGIDRALAAWLIEIEPFSKPQLLEHDEVAWAGPTELEALRLVDSDRDLLRFVLPLIEGDLKNEPSSGRKSARRRQ